MEIEIFANQEGRHEKIKEVRSKIDELGIKYIYYQFVSVTGRIVGKGVPADHWEKLCKSGFQLVYGATANLYTDRHDNYIGYGPEEAELVGMPEPETFCQLPWDKAVARVFCTCFRNREEKNNPGGYLTSDCRSNLRILHEEFQNKHNIELRAGTEPEMMWLTKDENGKASVGITKPNCYHIDQFEALRPIFMKVIEYSRAMGIDMIQGDHEDAPGQLELNFTYDEVLRNADRLTTYRQICAQVARENNLIACFMSKPFSGVSASGCHHNLSLWKGGEEKVNKLGMNNLPGLANNFSYRNGGENLFMPTDDTNTPSKIGLSCIGGIVNHLPALTALGCPTVNSYRRLWDTGFWAPIFSDWGYQNRTCGLRVSAPGRFEYRAADSFVNPYLLGGAIIKAFENGMANNMDPGEPEERNIYDAIEAGKKVKKLPMSLGDALNALEKDEVIKKSLPGDMYRVFMHYKKNEWETFMHTVTDWDLETYIDYLP